MVDHLNRVLSAADMQKAYAPTVAVYGASKGLSFGDGGVSAGNWLVMQLK